MLLRLRVFAATAAWFFIANAASATAARRVCRDGATGGT